MSQEAKITFTLPQFLQTVKLIVGLTQRAAKQSQERSGVAMSLPLGPLDESGELTPERVKELVGDALKTING